MTDKPFDHGVLNMPGRTSTINADLDRHLAAQSVKARTEARARSAKFKADKASAASLLAELGAAIVASTAPGIAKRKGITAVAAASAVNHELRQMVKWEPAKFLAIAEQHRRERAVTA